jgi:hypothetical protein
MLIGIPCTSSARQATVTRPPPQQPFIETTLLIHSAPLFSLQLTATGSAGLINTISMLSQSHVLSGVFGVITSVGWAVQTVFGGWLYKRVWDFKNNNEGISFQNVSRGFGFATGKRKLRRRRGETQMIGADDGGHSRFAGYQPVQGGVIQDGRPTPVEDLDGGRHLLCGRD